MGRVAVIDIGTVTCRLGVADVAGGRVERCAKTSTICNLGEGVAETGRLSEAACARVLACVDQALAQARAAGVPIACCTLTSAARDAENSAVLLDGLRARGVVPEVIPGEVEGSLTFLGVAQDFRGQRIMVADNGGGSTEIAVGTLAADGGDGAADGGDDADGGMTPVDAGAAADDAAPATSASARPVGGVAAGSASDHPAEPATSANALTLEAVRSLNVGCRRVTDLFLSREDPPSAASLDEARKFCRNAFEEGLPAAARGAAEPSRLVCVGGTVTTLVAISAELNPYDPAFVHLHELSLAEVDALAERLASLPLERRREVVGLQPKRAGVIVAGAVCVGELMRACGVGALTVSESDLLFGLSLVADATAQGRPSPIGWHPELFALR